MNPKLKPILDLLYGIKFQINRNIEDLEKRLKNTEIQNSVEGGIWRGHQEGELECSKNFVLVIDATISKILGE